jgi:hypothetical protein
MAGYDRAMIDKIAGLERKLTTVVRYCETEEETHRNNVNFTTDKGYVYYSKEMTLIPERRDKEISTLEARRDTLVATKQSMIDKLQTEIGIINEKVNRDIEAVNHKYSKQTEEYIENTRNIEEKLSQPSGKTYLRNKELIDILQDEIAKTRREWNEIAEKELERKRTNAIAQVERDKAEADRKDREERQQAWILMKEAEAAKNLAKAARWKLLDEKIRQEEEEEEWVEKEMEKLNSIKE